MVKTAITNITSWIKDHKKESFILFVILIIASFMRLYRISEYMTFLGDEGRDVIIVRRFLQQGDIMLIGPGTSIGNMYLGPIYYYMMAPALFAFMYSPVGPAVMIAVLGIITVALIWWVGRSWFNPKAGLIAAALYSIAPTIIIYSRSSWNPNIMPFFALVCVWGIWKVWQEHKLKWLPIIGVSLAFCLQSHYLALLLVPVLGLFWILTIRNYLLSKKSLKSFVIYSVIMIVLFLLLMSPLAIFDIRHNFMNFRAIKAFFTDRQTTVSIKPWNAIPQLFPQLTFITGRLVTGYNVEIAKWMALIFIGGMLIMFKHEKFKFSNEKIKAYLMLVTWLGVALVGLSLYKQQIYDHYYGFIFPAFFLLAGGVISFIWNSGRIKGAWIAVTILIALIWVNLSQSPLQFSPNKQLPRSEEVSQFILKESNSENFNFAVIAERNYEGAYQYFLEKAPNFRVINPQDLKNTLTQQLFVVCEMDPQKCDPTHNPKTEIANFGWTKIENTWNVSGVIVYKLVHSIPATPLVTPTPVPTTQKRK